jgi:DNA-binding CsgD family transcriptional regulator
MDAALIDRIYECGFVPDLWPEVLRDASKLSGSAGASLFVAHSDVSAWTASRNAHDVTQRFISEGWYWRGRLMSRVHGSTHPGFLRDLDICSPEELDEEPIYRDFWRRIGLGFGTTTAFALPTGESVSVILSRLASDGPVEAAAIRTLDALRPHLARTAILSARMKLERARAAGDALAALGLAALVFERSGKVLTANSMAEARSGLLRWRGFDRVTLVDSKADALLSEALARIHLEDNSGVRSFPVRLAGSDELFVGHLVPIRFSAQDIFAGSAAIFLLMPVSAPAAPPLELMRSLFDLTPAEARVARGLAAGKVVEEIASESGVSPNTVRVQVRALLEKTGLQRQTDVVALLTGLMPVRASEPPRGGGGRP